MSLTRAAFLKGDKKRIGGSGGDPWGPTPDPGPGASVELLSGDARGLLDLIRVSETQPGNGHCHNWRWRNVSYSHQANLVVIQVHHYDRISRMGAGSM